MNVIMKKVQKKKRLRSKRKMSGNSDKVKLIPQRNGTKATTSNVTNNKDKKALIIAQEIKFARLLAGNDKRTREKVLKYLKKWLSARRQSSIPFVEADFMRLWKGLYYCMWMSDKPLVQEELAESLSQIIHCFTSKEIVALYTKCTLKTLGMEWIGIDQHRMDKFQMLIRRILRQIFQVCKNKSWDKDWVQAVADVIQVILTDPKVYLGFKMHFTEIYLEELAKVGNSEIPTNIVTEFIRPYIVHFAGLDDIRQMRHEIKLIFRYLILQSDVGLDYQEKFEAWKNAGFPCENIDDIEKVEVQEEEEDDGDATENQWEIENDKPLDPRAGRVNVDLPQIPFDAQEIADLILKHKFFPTSTSRTRKQMVKLAEEFSSVANGVMPFGVKQIRGPEIRKKSNKTRNKCAALRLLEFDNELYGDESNGGKRKRKRNGEMVNEDEEMPPETSEFMEVENNDKKKLPLDKTSSHDRESGKSKIHERDDPSSCSSKIAKVKANKKKLLSNSWSCDSSSQNDTSPTSETMRKMRSLLKMKKLQRSKSLGTWDVLETKIPVTPSKSLENISVKPSTPVTPDAGTSNSSNPLLNSGITWLTPVLTKLEHEKPSQLSGSKTSSPSSSVKKKVKIMLERNTSQHTVEYIRKLRESPAIPYDANKKPLAGVLKASPLPSPVNPFYRNRLKF